MENQYHLSPKTVSSHISRLNIVSFIFTLAYKYKPVYKSEILATEERPSFNCENEEIEIKDFSVPQSNCWSKWRLRSRNQKTLGRAAVNE